MVFKSNKKGQAAIEFLMTYGWMLLVVLIVGALIFSFVDFGSLLPNKLDLSNGLRGSPGDSVAYSEGTSTTTDKSEVRVIFSYIGARQAQINYSAGTITTSLSKSCYSYKIENLDTQAFGIKSSTSDVPFLNGQTGMMYFACGDTSGHSTNTSTVPTVGKLLKNDVLDGRIVINVLNPKTKLSVASAGPIRLAINQ